ncbi:ATP adenylyltransferase-domain-containing protein [Cristinia sonorae]|uniref:ATP adenylyltransferase-domain-containing protein n=1 Tax=Cristinia sonorae TaxID=1940300 RepID=A0A8K0UZ56_9AGAR|nr:ATP adenylyltransferase-domain-containing protein [Cristinia sonorae]
MPATPNAIIKDLPERFQKAKESGDLLFFPSTIHKHVEGGVEYEIRLCPALQHKPNLPTPHFDAAQDQKKAEIQQGKPDPFAPPYVPNLYIGELKDVEEDTDYVVLFNKFSVVPHHILLVTKEFHSQTAPLMSSDLVQAYQLILAARAAGQRFFAFYNCGNLSGASQPHKHLQLIPIEGDGPPIEKLARSVNLEVPNKPFTLNSLPYANHIYRLPSHLGPNSDAEELSHYLMSGFMGLLDLTISSIRHDPTYPTGPPSYNVLLTLEHIHLIPRREEWYVLKETQEKLSVNSLGYAGMLLVKSDSELEAVCKEGVSNILRGTGVGSVHDLQVQGNDGEQDSAL